MKIKWNWGTGILLFILLFIGSLVWRVWLAGQIEINLVSKDYYPKGINYQQEIDHSKTFNELGIDFPVLHDSSWIKVDFSSFANAKEIQGEIKFYRPSSYHYDKEFKIKFDSLKIMYIRDNGFIRGRYIVKFNFKDSSNTYFHEKQFIF